MIGDLCDCDRMLVECPGGYEDCGDDPLGEEWGQEYDDTDPTDDTCCYMQGGPERCYCAERNEGRPVVTVGGVL